MEQCYHAISDEFLWSLHLKVRGHLCSSSSLIRTCFSYVNNQAVLVATVMNHLSRPCEFSAVVWRLVFSTIASPEYRWNDFCHYLQSVTVASGISFSLPQALFRTPYIINKNFKCIISRKTVTKCTLWHCTVILWKRAVFNDCLKSLSDRLLLLIDA